MHLIPELRLGAGQDGTPQDFANLMGHKWFESINSELRKCFSEPVPLQFEPKIFYAAKDHKKKL